MKVAIATKNPGKIEGVKKAFEGYFDNVEIIGFKVNSDVSEQPLNDEIFIGAKNRIKNLKVHCKKENIVVDLYASVESGITDKLGDYMITNIAVLEDDNGFESFGTSPSFPIPNKYVDEIIDTELGIVMDRIFSSKDSKKGKGGIASLTKGEISRIDLTKLAFIMALTRYLNKDVWN